MTPANHLAQEKSPYLQQHASNPVDWYPWGPEALTLARQQDKPIFLSIGYSTCHWCHVMARESFADPQVAAVLNHFFVAIKVDREERPDIDSLYMAACQMMTGSGGWPLTLLLTPEQQPFFAATYLSPGQLLDLVEQVDRLWHTDRAHLVVQSQKITAQLQQLGRSSVADTPTDAGASSLLAQQAANFYRHFFDAQWGGFGSAPKFPAAYNLLFLQEYAQLSGERDCLDMAEKTLEQMYRGGIYDHIGYGFCRYATDDQWLLPHFEKMLYDNALLAMAYTQAYQITGRDLYQRVARQTLSYVLRELRSPEGAFYAAQDADSQGEEGKYYTWVPQELVELLGEEDGAYFNHYFDLESGGHLGGKSIPNLLSQGDYEREDDRIARLRPQVYQHRLSRVPLHRDEKVLTAWNALMIAALAQAGAVLEEEGYLVAARQALAFVDSRLCDEKGGLLASMTADQPGPAAFLDDYAYLIWALLELYEATGEAAYLQRAFTLQQTVMTEFADEEQGGFYLTSRHNETLIARTKELYDGALPSGNSVIAYNLVQLSRYSRDPQWADAAQKQLAIFTSAAQDYPMGYSFFLRALLRQTYPGQDLVCVASQKDHLAPLQAFRRQHCLPNLLVLVKNAQETAACPALETVWQAYDGQENEPVYYLCQNQTCQPPTTDWAVIEKQLLVSLPVDQ